MSLLVVGTVGIDTIETPTTKRENLLGGSAAYFAYAASFYTKVHLISVVGQDFPSVHRTLLESRDVDLSGLQVALGDTFKWTGRYHEDMINRDTLKVELNVFGTFDPKVPKEARDVPFVFLANGAPAIQRKVLHQMARRPVFVAADTMDLWIETARPELDRLLTEVDAIILNDSEARLMTGRRELLRAGLDILEMGPRIVIIKKGEHGALVVSKEGHFAVPGFPLEDVFDPTGAGDTFAGGIMGFLAERGRVDRETLRQAVAHGTVVASYTVQDFSLESLKRITRREIEHRYAMLLDLVGIPAVNGGPGKPAPKAKGARKPARKAAKGVARFRKPAKKAKKKR
ncbi:MAG: sugar kinase [Planctomycetota bacterium]|nr:sugar kinase [Planctomycetota bacterium]